LPGRTAYQRLNENDIDRIAIVDVISGFLRRLHSLPEDGHVSDVIDVARAGAADRYQEFAILWNCLGDFDTKLQKRLFVSYGITVPDERKLRFHVSLDEFF
jgi:hypothetical protein